MKMFLHLCDIEGRQHLVNPAHIAAISESDAGCAVYLRGRGIPPIALSETVEVMQDALESVEEADTRPHSRWRR
jgi:hypothetical protein